MCDELSDVGVQS